MPSLNRRALLVSTGSVLTSVFVGCTAPVGEKGGIPDYATWIPASVGEVTLNVLVTKSNSEEPSNWGGTKLELDSESIDYNISLGAWGEAFELDPDILDVDIVVGQFDQETVTDTLLNEDTGEPADGEYAEYQLYGEDPYVGVRDGAMVCAREIEHFEATVDARRGETKRLVDTHEDFGLLVERISEGDVVAMKFLREHRVARTHGRSITFSDDRERLQEVRVYENEGIAREQSNAVRNEFEYDYYSDLEVIVKGRTIIVEVTKI